jgi:hypothetical protein
MWSAIENNIGILCACLVHLRPLVARYIPALLGLPDPAKPHDMMKGPGSPPGAGQEGIALRTFGQGEDKDRPIGVLTELELEESRLRTETGSIRNYLTLGTAAEATTSPLGGEPTTYLQSPQKVHLNALQTIRRWTIS